MITKANNPFNITKAVDFSDREIVSFWVDFPDEDNSSGFRGLVKPTSPMPMFILGGKGSGKTHLMRYYSFACQALRHEKNILNGVCEEGYIGAYVLCGGIRADRFKRKDQSDELWDDIFAYSLELWLSQILLDNISRGNFLDEGAELQIFLREVSSLLGRDENFGDLDEVIQLLRGLQMKVDHAVNNMLLDDSFDLKIELSGGQLIYGLPIALRKSVSRLENCLIVYLIDEFENLTGRQQRYVNTLVRERKEGSTFKIGSRLYGVKTYQTFSDEEENKEGSEFETLWVDAQLRKEEAIYKRFALTLVAARLRQSSFLESDTAIDEDSLRKSLATYFLEKSPEQNAEAIMKKYENSVSPWLSALSEKLDRGLRSDATPGIGGRSDIEVILENLQCESQGLLEKLNCFQFYKDWSKKINLLESSQEVRKNCENFIEGERDSQYANCYSQFKLDLLAQMLRSANHQQKYVGLDSFVKMSWGVPRNLFIILKNIYSWSDFKGERPFAGGKISEEAQVLGVSDSANWFFEDARSFGPRGHRIQVGINRLATLLRTIRFSDKPSECSPSSFSCDFSSVSESAFALIKEAERWSLLVGVGRRRHKNSARMLDQFQINRMLAPKWDLPVARRGVVELTKEEVEAIFVEVNDDPFAAVLEQRSARMTAPYFGKDTKAEDLDLFS